MKILLLMIAFALSGCAYQTNGWEIRKAVDLCDARGGIDYIHHIAVIVRCNDGSAHNILGSE